MEVPVHPVQTKYSREQAYCPQVVTAKAYEVYCHLYSPQASLARGERGGFGVNELIAFLYAATFPKEEWRQRVDEAFVGMQNI